MFMLSPRNHHTKGGIFVLISNIMSLCQQHNMTISKLERTIGLSNATIRRWDKASPSVDNLIKVADYFNVSLDWLADRTPPAA